MTTVAVRQGRVKNLKVEKEGEFKLPPDSIATKFPGYKIHPLYEMGVETKLLCQLTMIEPGKQKCHDHAGENFLYIVEGEGEYFVDNNKTIPVKAGDFCHAMPFEPHGIKCLSSASKPIKYLAIEWNPRDVPRPATPITARHEGRVKHIDIEKEGQFKHPAPDYPFIGYSGHSLIAGSNTEFLCNIARIQPGTYKNHSHQPENFMVILEGEGEYFVDEQNSIPVKAGDICHAKAFEPHGIRCLVSASKPIKYLVIEGPRVDNPTAPMQQYTGLPNK